MLRPARMKKLQVLALEEFRYETIKRLQELGTIHLNDYTEKLADPNWNNLLRPLPFSPNIRKIAAQSIAVNRSLDLFERYDPEPREGFIKGLFAPLPSGKLEARAIYGRELVDKVDDIMGQVQGEIERPVKEIERVEEEAAELERISRLLGLILALEIDLADIGDSEFLSIALGMVPKERIEDIRESVRDLSEDRFYLGARGAPEDKLVTVLICPRERAALVLANLRRLDWERIAIEGQRGKPKEAMGSINKRLAVLREEKVRNEALIVDIGRRWRVELKKYHEFLMIERQREETQHKFARMEHVVAIEGWVPAHAAAQATQGIREVSREACVVEISDPEEGDDVPVQLNNPKFVRSFELLTRLYGLPSYNGVDPTVFLAPGFLLFFSIMLTDAMYGAIALLLGVLLIRGGGRYNQTIRDGGIILSSAGAATILIGALSGGWFGGFGLKLPLLAAIQVFDPIVQVTGFLLVALSIGLVHVNAGVVINVLDNLKRRQTWKAVTGNLWFLLLQPGLFFYVVGYKSAGLVFVLISGILLLMGHRAMAMFQVTGFMGDILSYARLMALGLCTTGIAMTVNVLSGMLYMVGSIGVIIAVIVFLIGHVFNFLINAMGSFVHGLRLHYVEFFTKFYRSGGTEFAPLEMRAETMEIK